MSAILSADDLNDFISPGVACIKPVETLPLQKPEDTSNPYEVTTEDKLPAEPPPPAQITLTDCLACSGCVTSAEAVLISLQSHSEVLHALDSAPPIQHDKLSRQELKSAENGNISGFDTSEASGKVFVSSVSPQVRASLAATYGTSEQEAGWMIEQLLSGPHGLKTGGTNGNGFTWVVDTNAMRELALVLGADEVLVSTRRAHSPATDKAGASTITPSKPILTSACPGWICYAEKTHPHILPHLSRLKSPQALTGTLLKTILSRALNISPAQIWHMAIMPCFDKKLEASRQELTDLYWLSSSDGPLSTTPPVRDVDCVITAREILMLAESRGISFPALPRSPLPQPDFIPFPDPTIDAFLFPRYSRRALDRRRTPPGRRQPQQLAAGSSGGYLYHILRTQQALYPGSEIHTTRGRNADVVDYSLIRGQETIFRAARYYGFRNIQNLVRKLKPVKKSRMPGGKVGTARKPGAGPAGAKSELDYTYVEVMACPGGCTNGGGQIKVEDVGALQGVGRGKEGQKEWLARVDEAYYSMEEEKDQIDNTPSSTDTRDADGDVPMHDGESGEVINGINTTYIRDILAHWADITGLKKEKLCYTTYRAVESDVGKDKEKGREMERVVELAGRIGGGW
ncbi:Cytosolic Fe-S cluster assembly factor nar1 [Trapelia coarctata]|nr:Cytosolic Fe-S cluster assembly factor nar1 [Trapelia coarctata]